MFFSCHVGLGTPKPKKYRGNLTQLHRPVGSLDDEHGFQRKTVSASNLSTQETTIRIYHLKHNCSSYYFISSGLPTANSFPPKKTTSNTQSSTPQPPPSSPPWQTGPFGLRARLGRLGRPGATRRSHGGRLRGAGRGALLLGHGEAGAGGMAFGSADSSRSSRPPGQ